MNRALFSAVNFGVKHNARMFFEANKVAITVVVLVFAPALMLIHLPVSLSILSSSEHKGKARLVILLFHVISPIATSVWLLRPSEVQWLMQVYSLRRIFLFSLVADLKRNIVFFGLWLSSPLVFYYSEEAFDTIEYLKLFVVCLMFYVFSFVFNFLLKYKILSGAFNFLPGLLDNIKRYIWIMRPLGLLIIGLSISGFTVGVGWKIIAVFFSALMITQSLTSEMRDERMVLFWKHCYSLSTPGLLLRVGVRDVGVAAILLLLAWGLFRFEGAVSNSLFLLVFVAFLYQLIIYYFGKILIPIVLMMVSYYLMFL